MSLTSAMISAIAVSLVVWAMSRPARQGDGSSGLQPDGSVVVRHSGRAVGAVLTLAPWLGLIRVVREPDPTQALAGVGLLAGMSALAGALWAMLARRTVASRDGVRISKPFGRSIPWKNLRRIRVGSMSRRQALTFIDNDGKSVAVDNTMQGWPQLLEALPRYATDETRPEISRVLAIVADKDREYWGDA